MIADRLLITDGGPGATLLLADGVSELLLTSSSVEGLTLHVEFSPGTGPFDEPTWVDLLETGPHGCRVFSVECSDGKRADLEEFPPGEATIVLRNDDRLFDPDHTGGTYYGQLNPRVPFRVWVQVDDIEYGLFYGFVEDGFLPTYTPPAGAICTVRLVDLVAVINGYTLPGVFELALKSLDPVALWFLDGPAGATKVADAVGGNEGTVFDEPQFGQDPLAPGLGTCAAFDGLNDRIDISRSWIWPRTHENWSVVSVIRTDTASEVSSEHPIFLQTAGNNSADIDMVNVTTDGTVQRYAYRGGVGFPVDFSIYNETPVDDGEAHLIIAQSDGVGSEYGVAVDSATLEQNTVEGAGQTGNGVAIGGTPFAAKDYTDNQFEGSIAVVAAFDYALDSTERGAVVTGYAALDGQRSDQHVQWALDAIGVPASMYSLAEGVSIMGPALTRGRNAVEFIQSVARTEQGAFYVDHAAGGVLRFDARFHSFTATRSVNTQVTFTDDPAAVDPFARVTPDGLQIEPNGVAGVINQATVTWRDGEEVVDESAGSPYGPRPVQIDTEATSPNVARGIGQWVVALNDTPRTRVRSLMIDPGATGGFGVAAGVRIRDRAVFRHHPQEVGSASSKALEVLGRQHVLSGPEWQSTFYLAEAPADGVDLFTLGTSELDGTHILAY